VCAWYWLLIFFFLDFGGARVHVCVCAVLAAVFSFVNLSITAVRTRKVSVFALLYSIHLLYRYKRTHTDTLSQQKVVPQPQAERLGSSFNRRHHSVDVIGPFYSHSFIYV
jgi:hypothetical protein